MQIRGARVVGPWLSDEMVSSGFLIDGFGGQLTDLRMALSQADQFRSVASDAVHRLVAAGDDTDHEHQEVAKMLIPYCKNFIAMLVDAENVNSAAHDCVLFGA